MWTEEYEEEMRERGAFGFLKKHPVVFRRLTLALRGLFLLF